MKTDSSSLHFYILRSMQYFLAIRRDTEDTPHTRTFAFMKIKVFHSVREFAMESFCHLPFFPVGNRAQISVLFRAVMTPMIMPAGPDAQLRVGWSENSV